jgi:hypothetical protein
LKRMWTWECVEKEKIWEIEGIGSKHVWWKYIACKF